MTILGNFIKILETNFLTAVAKILGGVWAIYKSIILSKTVLEQFGYFLFSTSGNTGAGIFKHNNECGQWGEKATSPAS